MHSHFVVGMNLEPSLGRVKVKILRVRNITRRARLRTSWR